MKAVFLDSEAQLSLMDIPLPEVGDGDVLVRVGACGICASDLHLAEINKGILQIPHLIIPGHEIAGTIVEVGTGVTHVHAGEHVAVNPVIPCGVCTLCRKGQPHLCRNAQVIGLHRPGGFAEYVVVPAANAYTTGNLPDSIAACAEPLACVLHGVLRLDPGVADRVLIFGAGTIGLLALQLLRHRGVGRIAVVERHPGRLRLAKELGADAAVPADAHQAAALAEIAPAGFDGVIDATGVPAVIEIALQHVAAAGTLLLLGSPPAEATIPVRPRGVQRWDITVIGSFGFHREFALALSLLQERCIRVDSIVTHRYPLDALPQAMQLARSLWTTEVARQPVIKIHITP